MKKKKKKSSLNKRRIDKSKLEAYDYHLPVLLKESVDMLVTDNNGIYIDGTLGGGGHTAEILSRLSLWGKVYSFDLDKEAVEHCSARFKSELTAEKPRLFIINKRFSEASGISGEHRGDVSGLLLDLGVSSRQLDAESRGLSYRVNTRLDMRFGEEGLSARELLHAASEEDMVKVLWEYGEEPFARVIARRLIERRRAGTLETTFDLRDAVIESINAKNHFKSLSRVFQAVRIAVNNELGELEKALSEIPLLFKPGGRAVVISYHSLEDRIVKNKFRELSKPTESGRAFEILTKNPILPSEEEIERNPRARSAKMRVLQKM